MVTKFQIKKEMSTLWAFKVEYLINQNTYGNATLCFWFLPNPNHGYYHVCYSGPHIIMHLTQYQCINIGSAAAITTSWSVNVLILNVDRSYWTLAIIVIIFQTVNVLLPLQTFYTSVMILHTFKYNSKSRL